MTFGEALRSELIQIEKLYNKVFPIIAPQKTIVPFLVYRREIAEDKNTLRGISGSISSNYTLSLQANSYAEKEELEELIKIKANSFLGRTIGNNGPYIQAVGCTLLGEGYVEELNVYSSVIRIEVDY